MPYILPSKEIALSAKPFKLRGESGIVDLVEDYDVDTYQAIYTVKYEDAVYVTHCFQKKINR